MARKAVPRLLLTAPASGSGKTTVTCALLRALVKRKCAVCAFKSGPDYIDPMFHSVVTGTRSDNLDLFLFGGHGRGEAVAKRLLCEAGEEKTVAVLEGAMGFYDGLGLSCDYSANLRDLVTLRVVNIKFVVPFQYFHLLLAYL